LWLAFEDALALGVVQVADLGSFAVLGDLHLGQAVFGIVVEAAQAVTDQVAIGIELVVDGGDDVAERSSCAVGGGGLGEDGLVEAEEFVTRLFDIQRLAGCCRAVGGFEEAVDVGVRYLFGDAGEAVGVGVIRVALLTACAVEAGQAGSSVVACIPGEGDLIQFGDDAGFCADGLRDGAAGPEVLGDLGDAAGCVVLVAAEFRLGHAAVGIEGSLRGITVAQDRGGVEVAADAVPSPALGLVQGGVGDGADQRGDGGGAQYAGARLLRIYGGDLAAGADDFKGNKAVAVIEPAQTAIILIVNGKRKRLTKARGACIYAGTGAQAAGSCDMREGEARHHEA
jgi:hypothetical protein